MIPEQIKNSESKNIYLVGGILSLFVVFMVASVMMVVSQVSQGSSADMLRKRLAEQKQEEMKLKNSESKTASYILGCSDSGGNC
ncbi:MAG: hypothetical protein U9R27_01730 [Campylobacterota bacterium]|nr:hypothetical protein [Campylobacterota bacterium]